MEENLKKAGGYSPLVLAYIGDSYFELLVRDRIVNGGNCNISELFGKAKKFVTAVSQSSAVDRLTPLLTEEEESIYKRGRNAKTNHTPRSAGSNEYHRATGLETLFGWLYVSNQEARAKQLFELCFPAETEETK